MYTLIYKMRDGGKNSRWSAKDENGEKVSILVPNSLNLQPGSTYMGEVSTVKKSVSISPSIGGGAISAVDINTLDISL